MFLMEGYFKAMPTFIVEIRKPPLLINEDDSDPPLGFLCKGRSLITFMTVPTKFYKSRELDKF